jgi:hypothetical protein
VGRCPVLAGEGRLDEACRPAEGTRGGRRPSGCRRARAHGGARTRGEAGELAPVEAGERSRRLPVIRMQASTRPWRSASSRPWKPMSSRSWRPDQSRSFVVADSRRLLMSRRAAYEVATATHEAATSCPASGIWGGGLRLLLKGGGRGKLLLGAVLGF